ncbi:50S ribosomal protein L13 [Pajaroellobacter abortibovis]|uniref:Large ribosomal subunit protein uL13 n=1 Tax=Pajaroellobacter abortibovis TaxID=1882918 RepID=A0A1L6MYT5_9BACT|nr:50S ribosomal protein L13 [Pajaroellobacter abortibovis]APS00693.1 50S ribosomal protein L13 [Pajaroellobacter abortibovis]
MLARTFVPSKGVASADRKWFVVDASGKPLGRLASEIARVLRGKHKPTFTPHEDIGDFVIVVNASKILLTGNKLDKKKYCRHSGIPGGFREESYRHLFERKPTFPIEKAVRGMLPKNVLGRRMFTKLKVYASSDHPHVAQNPIPFPFPVFLSSKSN